MPRYLEMDDGLSALPLPKFRSTPIVQRHGEKVDLTKYYRSDAEFDPLRPRPGAMAKLAQGAIAHSRIEGHGYSCVCNDGRIRLVRQALDGLSTDELEWLAGAVTRAAKFAHDRGLSRELKNDIRWLEDQHHHGEHTKPQPPDRGWDPECPLCNPNDWRKYWYG